MVVSLKSVRAEALKRQIYVPRVGACCLVLLVIKWESLSGKIFASASLYSGVLYLEASTLAQGQ